MDERLEEVLLGAPADLTRDDVADAAGVPEPEARAIWRALGFPAVAAGERAFTRRDLEALRTVLALRDSGLLDTDTLLALARSMGQELARMAEAQVDVFRVLTDGIALTTAEETASVAAEVLPQVEQLVVFVWRRQFAAAVARAFAEMGQEGQREVGVGFLDLVDFTRSTRSWDSATLARLLERFEGETALRVTAVGGRVVKTLGDGVLYVTDDARSAVDVALETVDAHAHDEELPDVAAGVAYGPVLVRLGDVFGEPVNLASRLCDEARPDSVLVHERVAQELEGDPRYDVKRLKRRSVRGYRTLTPWTVQRSSVEAHERPARPDQPA